MRLKEIESDSGLINGFNAEVLWMSVGLEGGDLPMMLMAVMFHLYSQKGNKSRRMT